MTCSLAPFFLSLSSLSPLFSLLFLLSLFPVALFFFYIYSFLCNCNSTTYRSTQRWKTKAQVSAQRTRITQRTQHAAHTARSAQATHATHLSYPAHGEGGREGRTKRIEEGKTSFTRVRRLSGVQNVRLVPFVFPSPLSLYLSYVSLSPLLFLYDCMKVITSTHFSHSDVAREFLNRNSAAH